MRNGRRHRMDKASGFHITRHVRAVCQDMVARLPELSHIDLTRVAVSFSQARKGGPYGLYASLTPMRFAGGARVEKRRGRYYKSQLLLDESGNEILYILSVCLPRFMDIEFREKLATIMHELWHIGPRFDGDIRRHGGRCYAHSGSKERYDAQMEQFVDRWLALGPDESLYHFLQHRFEDLQRLYGGVYGLRISRPKLLLISADEARQLQQQSVPTG